MACCEETIFRKRAFLNLANEPRFTHATHERSFNNGERVLHLFTSERFVNALIESALLRCEL